MGAGFCLYLDLFLTVLLAVEIKQLLLLLLYRLTLLLFVFVHETVGFQAVIVLLVDVYPFLWF
jgi:hypothetical protein